MFLNEDLKRTNLALDLDATNMFMLLCRTRDLVKVLADDHQLWFPFFKQLIALINIILFYFILIFFFIWFNVNVPKYFLFRVVSIEDLFFSSLLLKALHYAMSLIKTASANTSSP